MIEFGFSLKSPVNIPEFKTEFKPYLTYYTSKGDGPEKTNWFKARENCKKMGGDLVSIHSLREMEYVNSIVTFFML